MKACSTLMMNLRKGSPLQRLFVTFDVRHYASIHICRLFHQEEEIKANGALFQPNCCKCEKRGEGRHILSKVTIPSNI